MIPADVDILWPVFPTLDHHMNYGDMYTLHSWCGMMTVASFALQVKQRQKLNPLDCNKRNHFSVLIVLYSSHYDNY